jgi:hypothetical protein
MVEVVGMPDVEQGEHALLWWRSQLGGHVPPGIAELFAWYELSMVSLDKLPSRVWAAWCRDLRHVHYHASVGVGESLRSWYSQATPREQQWIMELTLAVRRWPSRYVVVLGIPRMTAYRWSARARALARRSRNKAVTHEQ